MGPAGNLRLTLFAFILLAVALLSRSRLRSLRPMAVPFGTLAALALWGVVQLLPLPEGVLQRLAPVNIKIYHEAAQILRLFGEDAARGPKISVAPAETEAVVLLLLSYGAIFFSTASLLRNRMRRRLLASVILISASLQILVAAAQESPDGRLHGAFVNANHFAGYLEIALALAFGALWAEVLSNRDRGREAAEPAVRFEKRFPALAGRILLWSVIATGIGLTRSRGALLAAGATTLILLTMAALHRTVKRRARAVAGVAIALLAGVLFVAATAGATPVLRFLESDPRELSATIRVTLWRTSLEAWRQSPIVGSGLGTFRDAFRRVQPRELEGIVEHAHSDPLQLLVTGGVVGWALGVLLFGSFLFLLVGLWKRQRHREESAFVLAGIGALFTLALHGLVEFNLSIPPIPATLACVLGLAWSAGRER